MQLSKERAEEIFRRMAESRVAVVGDLMVDRYFWGRIERISPEAPVPVVELTGETANLGGAANVAANVRSLGAQVQLFGVVGDDPEGELLRELVAKGSFGDMGVVVDPSRPTSVKTRIIANNQHVVRIDRESKAPLDQSFARNLLIRLRSALGGVHMVILEDYNKGVLTPSLIDNIIGSCREAHVPVGADPKLDNFWNYRGVTLFKPNVRELEAAVGRHLKEDDDLVEAAGEVKEKLEADHLLITRGEQGMMLVTDGDLQLIPTRARQVHDVSGAGDTVIATIMTALAGGATIQEAAYLANCAAGVVIAEVGAVPVDVTDLRHACSSD